MSQLFSRKGFLFCIVGPAGSGKTSLSERLKEVVVPALSVSVSVTTRQPRHGEVEGQSYFFVNEEHFEQLIAKGEFVEWENVHGYKYGTLRHTLVKAIETGTDLILRIDIRGALSLKRMYPDDTVIVFLLPPKFSDLSLRLMNRGDVVSSEFTRRIETAREEVGFLSREISSGVIDYVLVNDDFEQCLSCLQAVVVSERARAARIFEDSLSDYLR